MINLMTDHELVIMLSRQISRRQSNDITKTTQKKSMLRSVRSYQFEPAAKTASFDSAISAVSFRC